MKKLLLILLLISLITSGCGIKSNAPLKSVTLKYWRVWEDDDAFADLIKKYNQVHPNVKIEYRKLRYEEYENELLNAFAEDRGPDIFSIHNSWTKKYQNKIQPLPEALTVTYQFLEGKFKKELVQQARTERTLSIKNLKDKFADQVYYDAVIRAMDEKSKTEKEMIYGLPLSIDTLAMFYNKDLFNNAGIAEPAVNWDKKFLQDVKKLTKQNSKGKIIQSGVALGGSSNIDRAGDILSVLMMQDGSRMMDGGRVMFDSIPPEFERLGLRTNPGLEALIFYTGFANPAKEVYCWNKEMDNSLKMFSDNQLAILFGYSYFLPAIRANNPKLNFSVTKLPQIKDSLSTVNFANYWLETVSKKSKNPDEAWDFVQFITKEEQVESYLEKTKKPPALKSLLAKEKWTDHQEIGPFVEQVLTAKSWYKGKDPLAAEKIIAEMIEETVAGQKEPGEIIGITARRVQQTIE